MSRCSSAISRATTLPGFNYGNFDPENQYPDGRPGQRTNTAPSNGARTRRSADGLWPRGGPAPHRGNGASNNGGSNGAKRTGGGKSRPNTSSDQWGQMLLLPACQEYPNYFRSLYLYYRVTTLLLNKYIYIIYTYRERNKNFLHVSLAPCLLSNFGRLIEPFS